MEDRGQYKKCDLCNMYLWEAHAASNEKHSHLCTACFFQIPQTDYTESLKIFKKRIKEIEEQEVRSARK